MAVAGRRAAVRAGTLDGQQHPAQGGRKNTLQHAWQRARRRRALITLLLGLPWALAAAVLALRLAGFDIACVVGTVSLLTCAVFVTARARQLDRQWLQRQLDGSGASEDSADLLQRQRVHVLAMLEHAMPELRPRWPRGALALYWIAGLAIVVLAFGWPLSSPGSVPVRTPTPGSAAAAGPLRLQSTRLRIDAPAYTGQATLTQNALDAKVAADSRLSWSLRFDRAPDKAWLQFHDGRRLALSEREGQWQAQ
ncbi:hypothetical protein, partial [Klebsiella pneumoniae]|uniref:hypothetical protein n=1 Tax=Klebsiella pneumoniae TaxID=573 RepID=UPI0037C0508C